MRMQWGSWKHCTTLRRYNKTTWHSGKATRWKYSTTTTRQYIRPFFVTSHALHGCGLLLHTDGVCPTVCWSKPWAVQKRMNRSRCRLAGGQTRVGSVNHVCMYVCMYVSIYVIFIRSDKRTSNNKHKKQSQNYVHYKAAKPKNLFHLTKLYKERIRKDFL